MTREHDHTEAAAGRRPEVRVVRVTEVRYLRGRGCCEASPVRQVIAYYEGDTLLFELDPMDRNRDIPLGLGA